MEFAGDCIKAATSPLTSPLITSVRKEAAATRKLQPAALNFASVMRLDWSMLNEMRIVAPQVIDPARPTKASASTSPTLRGLRKCSLIRGESSCILKAEEG